MKTIIKAAAVWLACVAAASCTNTEQFRVNGTIEGDPTINLRVGYYADGAYRTLITAAREGEFEFFGSARQPAVVEIFDYDYRLLGRLYARNGQTLDVKLSRSNPNRLEVDGNNESKEWARFLSANADSLDMGGRAANGVIARYIDSHRGSLVSTLLLVTSFDSSADPVLADSLLTVIEPEARPSVLTDGFNYLLRRIVAETVENPVGEIRYMNPDDSVGSFSPSDKAYSLIVFSDENSRRTDSIAPLLRRLKASDSKRLALLDIGFQPDINDWKRDIRPDSATWTTAWVAGGPAASAVGKLGIARVPFYIVCDSTGAQLCRTPWAAEAEQTIKTLADR